ncbi:MAG: hypothetical protein ACRD5D_01505 [Candidatus Polarisedimenticolia bacterium]
MTDEPVLTHLRQALQALALPAESQLRLLPDFAEDVDDLVLNFDHWCRAVSDGDAAGLTPVQIGALRAIETLLDDMSGQRNARLWTRTAVRDNALWSRLRAVAQEALRAFGWELDVPPDARYQFIAW